MSKLEIPVTIHIDTDDDGYIYYAYSYHPKTGEEFAFEVNDMDDLTAQFIYWIREGYGDSY